MYTIWYYDECLVEGFYPDKDYLTGFIHGFFADRKLQPKDGALDEDLGKFFDTPQMKEFQIMNNFVIKREMITAQIISPETGEIYLKMTLGFDFKNPDKKKYLEKMLKTFKETALSNMTESQIKELKQEYLYSSPELDRKINNELFFDWLFSFYSRKLQINRDVVLSTASYKIYDMFSKECYKPCVLIDID